MQLLDNTLLHKGQYRITRFIASGGFGCTYEGIHTQLQTKVAIKEFFPKMFCNRDENTSHITVATKSNRDLVTKLRKKFNEEAKALFNMTHRNIVRVSDVFEDNGTSYYVMEYIDGASLNDIVKQRGALPEEEALKYIRQVADALKYVHSLNRLHLDIKPGNIMVDKAGNAILIDFGASKHYDTETGENTSTLMGVNTKGFAPIEQCSQSFTTFSAPTDIYALGATLYKLLTGETPPDAGLIAADKKALKPLPTTVSAATRNAVSKAMQVSRYDRPQNIDEFLALLPPPPDPVHDPVHDPIDDPEDIEVTVIERNDIHKPDSPAERRRNRRRKKSSKKWLFSLLLLLVLLVVGWFIYNQINEPTDTKYHYDYPTYDNDEFEVTEKYDPYNTYEEEAVEAVEASPDDYYYYADSIAN